MGLVAASVVDLDTFAFLLRRADSRRVQHREVEEHHGAGRAVQIDDPATGELVFLIQNGRVGSFGREGEAVGGLVDVGQIDEGVDVLGAQGVLLPVRTVAMPASPAFPFVGFHVAQAGFREADGGTEKRFHCVENLRVADDFFDCGPSDQRIAVDGLVGTLQGTPKGAAPSCAILVKALAQTGDVLVGEKLS